MASNPKPPAAGKPKPSKPSPPLPGVQEKDELFFHADGKPTHGRVVCHGKHGATIDCHEGKRHRVRWEHVAGFKRRAPTAVNVVEHGEDGAIVEDASGRKTYVHGYKNEGIDMDEGHMSKSRILLFGDSDEFAKAIANRPGLALQQTTDKAGHQTKRWKKTGVEMPGAKRQHHPDGESNGRSAGKSGDDDRRGSGEGYGTHNLQSGDSVSFKMGEISGHGDITATGKHGATVKDSSGREHQVHWHEISGHKSAEGTKKPEVESKVLGEQKPIEADKFVASDFAKSHDNAEVTEEEILADFPPDTSEKIVTVQDRLKAIEETIKQFKKDGSYGDERSVIHEKIISEIMSIEKIKAATPAEGESPTFTVLGGRGGSGKSWFNGKVYDESKAIVLDADHIKGKLPEYEGWNAAMVHEESSDIFDKITNMAAERGLNIVHDATMKNTEKAVALVNRFKDMGYRTEAHYMHLPRQEAAKRAVSRFLGKTQRYVPIDIVLSNKTNEESFDRVKGLVDKWSFRDNNVPQGQDPILISESGEGASPSGEEEGELKKSIHHAILIFRRK